MNAVTMLKKEHDEFKEYFKQFEEAGKKAQKKKEKIAEEVIKELKTHTQIEERIFYPAVQAKGTKEMGELILEGIEEHRLADYAIQRLQETDSGDETYDAKFKVLMESVKHHLKEEENQLFPEVRKTMKDDLNRLGEEMEALHKQLEGE
jgi:hemerythrin-like domain-containing protein